MPATHVAENYGDKWGLTWYLWWPSTLITATTSVHLPKLVSTNLTVKSDLKISFNQPNMECKAGWYNMFLLFACGCFIFSTFLWDSILWVLNSPYWFREFSAYFVLLLMQCFHHLLHFLLAISSTNCVSTYIN